MKTEDLQKQVVGLGRDVANWLAELTEDDMAQFEKRLDQLLDTVQKQYGWTYSRARKELMDYVDAYGERTQTAVDRTLDALNARFHSRKRRRRQNLTRLLWIGFGAGVFAVAWTLIKPLGDRD